MQVNHAIYKRLNMLHGPVWIDRQGNFWPVKFMSDNRMAGCLKFVRGRMNRVDQLVDQVQEDLELNSMSEKMIGWLALLTDLQQWELLFVKELERRGVSDA